MIVIINPNSTEAMTQAMLETAKPLADPIPVEAWTSHDGPPAIQGPKDGAAAVPPLMTLVAKAEDKGAQAIIIGCFDDTGLQEAQANTTCPVIGIGQAAYHMAAMLGGRFSVVTTLAVSTPILEANIKRYGLSDRVSKVRASGVPVLEVDKAEAKILSEIKLAATQDAISTVVLGCAGMVDLPQKARAVTPVHVIDGVRAAVCMARGLIG
ncbi:aspartate/glutamate racemase family protein [Epibacterium ulvae]|uniref:aspartate/glutamate racemase family protein n=1 Tax=Epibacterium ulvae TaxID=1156985 RepID=UPI001BFC7D06|nr:aspartate/glutamate racemase family protein [Epibacterium ulvae]MBT8156057.1 aspartate/glutamate racemase family protein [Epibacterium ulvae]